MHNRIIDLSYAAALKLDMIKDGTSLVEVTAISFDQPAGRPADTSQHVTSEPPANRPLRQASTSDHKVYVQVGAFGDRIQCRAPPGALSLRRHRQRIHSRGTLQLTACSIASASAR